MAVQVRSNVGTFDFKVGDVLLWVRDDGFTPDEIVTVVALRSRGCARLSNGWTVDEDGIALGTQRVKGGRVIRQTQAGTSTPTTLAK